MTRKWTGLLIEPIPELYQILVGKNRKVFSINACIADKRPIVATFKVGGALSGQKNAMDEGQKKRLNDEVPNSREILVPCFSLNTILKAIDVKKIDFFSLDIEGGEYNVLKSIDFNNVDIETFAIEHNNREVSIKLYREFFKRIRSNKYVEIKVTSQDSFFIKSPS